MIAHQQPSLRQFIQRSPRSANDRLQLVTPLAAVQPVHRPENAEGIDNQEIHCVLVLASASPMLCCHGSDAWHTPVNIMPLLQQSSAPRHANGLHCGGLSAKAAGETPASVEAPSKTRPATLTLMPTTMNQMPSNLGRVPASAPRIAIDNAPEKITETKPTSRPDAVLPAQASRRARH